LRTRVVAVATPLLLLAAPVAPASGTPTATATLAPIGANSGSYLVTVRNTGSETIENYSVLTGAAPTSVAPSGCRIGPVSGMFCQIGIAAGGESQMCYSGPAAVEVWLNGPITHVVLTVVAAVSSCPVAGFTPIGGGSTVSGKCVVPKVANKTLAAAEKALTKAHCKVGKIKRAKSGHVKKGRVISSSPAVGKSYAAGYKVNLVVSRGK
jgi:hypothetical protein